jgi:hypothetical protein
MTATLVRSHWPSVPSSWKSLAQASAVMGAGMELELERLARGHADENPVIHQVIAPY